MCVDVYNNVGPVVQSYTCNGGANQKWSLGADGLIHSGDPNLCLATGNPSQVWAGPLSDGSYAIILFNVAGATQNITVAWNQVFSIVPSTVSVRDLWAHKNLGQFSTGFSSEVPSHGVVMIKASPVA
eukprot:TRINITY_DN6976_c0_g1_i2.p2 TRINITY_DN6976_c0_g1~~TRINITY_DN6976_c0_g1_i2.p2  ORF type:complete len:127 (-),score=19.29 TRINITY_DN6976_c0_g1_i2:47-427(-)